MPEFGYKRHPGDRSLPAGAWNRLVAKNTQPNIQPPQVVNHPRDYDLVQSENKIDLRRILPGETPEGVDLEPFGITKIVDATWPVRTNPQFDSEGMRRGVEVQGDHPGSDWDNVMVSQKSHPSEAIVPGVISGPTPAYVQYNDRAALDYPYAIPIPGEPSKLMASPYGLHRILWHEEPEPTSGCSPQTLQTYLNMGHDGQWVFFQLQDDMPCCGSVLGLLVDQCGNQMGDCPIYKTVWSPKCLKTCVCDGESESESETGEGWKVGDVVPCWWYQYLEKWITLPYFDHNYITESLEPITHLSLDLTKWHVVGETPRTGIVTVEGETTMEGTLTGTGEATGTATLSGEVEIEGTLDTTGTATVSGNISVSGPVEVSGMTTVSGEVEVSGTVTLDEDISVSGNVSVSGPVEVSGITTVSGEVEVSGNIAATGTTTVSGDVEVTGPVSVTGDIHATGTVTASGPVTMETTFQNVVTDVQCTTPTLAWTDQSFSLPSGTATVAGTLNTSGATTEIPVNVTLPLQQKTVITGISLNGCELTYTTETIWVPVASGSSLTLSGTVNIPTEVTGTATLTNGTTVNISKITAWTPGSVTPQTATLSIPTQGTANITGTATLSGQNTLTGTATLSGQNTLAGTTTVSGMATLSGQNTMTGQNTLTGTATLSGQNTLTGTLAGTHNVTLSGSTATLTGQNTMTGTATLSGQNAMTGIVEIESLATLTGEMTGSPDVTLNLQEVEVTGTLTGTMEATGTCIVMVPDRLELDEDAIHLTRQPIEYLRCPPCQDGEGQA